MSDKKETQYRKTGRSKSSNQQHRDSHPLALPAPAQAPVSPPLPSPPTAASRSQISKHMQRGQSRANVTNVNPSEAGIASAPSYVLSSQSGRASETTVTFTPHPKRTELSVQQRSSRAVRKAPASVSAFWAEEQAKQRQLKAILNKLTPQNFEKQFEQVKAVNIDNATTLTGVISQIFDKALMEPTFCEMYANLCFHLAAELPDFSEDNEKITFKRLLLNKCQEEFERREREQEEANKADEEGEVKQPEEEREEKRIKARRRMLGNIRLIGELYKKKMLTERIMHECIKKLLGQQQTPEEEDIEALRTLMSTIGEMIDHLKAKEHMDAYFQRMESLSNNMRLSSTFRFMLKDIIDLRKNRWQQRRKVEGPKVGFTPQMGSQLPQLGNLGISIAAQYPQQQGGKFEGPRKTLVKITHPDTHEELRLVKWAYYPDGGSSAARTHPSVSQSQSMPSYATSHPTSYYTNAYNPNPLFFPSPNSHPLTSSHMPPNSQGAALTQNVPSEKSEERLRDMSLGAIKEFYSARDEKEVALCIKDLNSPSFHPSMISLWVTDAFERKDVERDLLAKLLVNLTKSQDGTLSQSQLIKGFEIVLSILEDAVIDAPRAPEFLGLILAKVILENVVSLNQIGQLIHEGGEVPGHLLKVGLAGNVLGNILEIIKSEKGESFLNEIRMSSNLRLETFRPPDPLKKSRMLEKFI